MARILIIPESELYKHGRDETVRQFINMDQLLEILNSAVAATEDREYILAAQVPNYHVVTLS
jgi:hypothetical protein